ncbi:phosphotransferase family protein [Devosia sp.]|uniref:phosphotransferase family protein n=1 Tax=Devosia sp. TaxID=1871048 RepID=UPI003A920BD9
MIDAALVGSLLGAGQVAEVFAYGDHVLKLYRRPEAKASVFTEAAVLAAIADHGLPVPDVHAVGQWQGRWGLVMDRAEGETLARFTPSGIDLVPGAMDEMLRLHRRFHAITDVRLPSLRQRLHFRIARSDLPPEQCEALLGRLAGLPDGTRLCHGDFHPFNILGRPGQTLVVDWLDAASGPPAADVCRTHLLVSGVAPDLADAYVAAYAAASDLSTAEILAWRPVLAAARLAVEGVDDAERQRLSEIAATA